MRTNGLIERSRALGPTLFDGTCAGCRARHPVIGDVRGGHGLFAVLELVADRVDARAARALAADSRRR